jgi:hypothetical protein
MHTDQKTPGIKTIVNKKGKINNVYRNYHLEVLAGVEDTITSVVYCLIRKKEASLSILIWPRCIGVQNSRVREKDCLRNSSQLIYYAICFVALGHSH